MRSTTRLILAVVLLGAAGACGSGRTSAIDGLRGVKFAPPHAKNDFTLVDTDGKPFHFVNDTRGSVTLLYFGYTNCPDVCPTTLATFKQVFAKLEAAGVADKVRFDFISVDPQRDTPEQLAKYVGYFDKDFVAATGSDEELTRVTRALGLIYSRESTANGDYAVDHSASAVLIDPAGREVGLFRPPFDASAIAADLATLAGSR